MAVVMDSVYLDLTVLEVSGGSKRLMMQEAGFGTLVEDLDLSYSAANKGYKFIYQRHCPQQLELPGNIVAHRKQKHRWTKGFMQVLRKRAWFYFKSSGLTWQTKIELWFHLTQVLQFFLLFFLSLLSPVVLYFDGWTAGLGLYLGAFPAIVHTAGIVITIYTKVSSSNGH